MNHGVVTCAMDAIVRIICGDPEAGVDGLVPKNVDLHAERFQCLAKGTGVLEDRTGKGFDRLVATRYEGTSKWADDGWSNGQLTRTFKVTISVGYLFGNHEDMTDPIIGDDEQDIAKKLKNNRLWPNCNGGCINGIQAKTSSIRRIEPDRKINDIAVEVTVTA